MPLFLHCGIELKQIDDAQSINSSVAVTRGTGFDRYPDIANTTLTKRGARFLPDPGPVDLIGARPRALVNNKETT